MDKLDFLDGQGPNGEAVTEAPVAEAPVAEAPVATEPTEPQEPEAARERDERGRFKPKEQPDQTMVPLAALHETRDKVRDLEARLAAIGQPQQPQAQAIPDMFEDPEGYQAYNAHFVRETVLNQTLNISEEMTRQQVGNDIVNEAQQWGQQAFPANPTLYQQFLAQRNPYGFLVEAYKREQSYSKLGDPKEIDAYLAWRQAQQAVQQPAPTAQAAPPQSIASAPSAGGMQQIATGPGVAFADTIK